MVRVLKQLITVSVCLALVSSAGFAAGKDSQKKISKMEKLLVEDGKYAEARESAESLLEENPDMPRLYADLGLADYGLMEYQKAYEEFKKADSFWTDPGTKKLVQYGMRVIEDNKEILDRIEKANISMRKDPGDENTLLIEDMAVWHFFMLNELFSRKQYYAAFVMPHILWIQEHAPGMEELSAFSAGVFYSSMLYGRAKEEYEKAIELDPDNAELHSDLADCLVAMGDLDGAQDQYQEAISFYLQRGVNLNDPRVVKLQRLVGALPRKYKDVEALMQKKQYIQAEDICLQKISLNPGDLAAITQLGQIYWETDRKKNAIRLFRKVTKIAPDYPSAHLFLGRAYFFEGKPEKGSKEFTLFEEKMDLLPKTDEDTDEFYESALHYMASLYVQAKMEEKAFRNYKKILTINPDSQEANYNLGAMYYDTYHNRSKAYKYLNRTKEIDPSSALAGMAELAIQHIRVVPDTRFEGTPRVRSSQGELQRVVRTHMMSGGINRMKEKKKGKDIAEPAERK